MRKSLPLHDPSRSKAGLRVETTGSVREAPGEKRKNSVELGPKG